MQSNKLNVIIDFDNTLANSSKKAVEYIWTKYSDIYKRDISQYDETKLKWNFAPFVNEEHREEAVSYMSTPEFFKGLEVHSAPDIDNSAAEKDLKSCLSILSKNYNLILCTKRDGVSFEYVKNWLKEKSIYDYFSNFVCVSDFDKAIVQGDYIVDDKIECLLNGTRTLRICFGDYLYTKEDFYENYKKLSEKPVATLSDWTQLTKVLDPYNPVLGVLAN